uniref:Fibrinogen C-terminal domain-containing protein n=1 Tax=Stomoxys calcitrans TaxID=35570 RepID=A0A1I8QD63_STOCA
MEAMNRRIEDIWKKLEEVSQKQDEQTTQLQTLKPTTKEVIKPSCQAAAAKEKQNATANSQWTTILRRQDGSVDFYRNWTDYKKGFGNSPNGEFFIGLEKLHELTNSGPTQELTIILRDWDNEERYANFDNFKIGNESEKYKIESLGKYSGNAEDAMTFHLGKPFSTQDRNNGEANSTHCAQTWRGAWWFNNCFHSHLFGPYRQEKDKKSKGINWMQWKGFEYSLKFAEMKIRAKTDKTESKS